MRPLRTQFREMVALSFSRASVNCLRLEAREHESGACLELATRYQDIVAKLRTPRQ
jgi:hypothetical protein